MDGFSLFVSSDQNQYKELIIFYMLKKNGGFVVVPYSHKNYKPEVKKNKDWIIFEKNKKGFEDLEKSSNF